MMLQLSINPEKQSTTAFLEKHNFHKMSFPTVIVLNQTGFQLKGNGPKFRESGHHGLWLGQARVVVSCKVGTSLRTNGNPKW